MKPPIPGPPGNDGPTEWINATGLSGCPPGEVRTFTPEEVAAFPEKKPGPVTLQDRQGVFAHSFKCSICDLEFVVFSWRADRHRVGTTFCPECGECTPMLHWAAQTSDSVEFQSDGPGHEIFSMCPFGGAMLDDSAPPPDDRYDFSVAEPGVCASPEAAVRGTDARPGAPDC